MCLYTKSCIIPADDAVIRKAVLAEVVQVADKDIVCYKRFQKVKGELITPYRAFNWPKSRCVKVRGFGTEIGINRASLKITTGLHAYTRNFGGLTRMIIPKGTKYIISDNGDEIVALKMGLASLKRKKKVVGKAKKVKRNRSVAT